jgi:hypothetical protein
MYSTGNPVQATIKWAAEHGFNGVSIAANWPSMLNRGRFKHR